jgi:hypothetical protein
MILIHTSVRGVFFVSLFIIGIGAFVISNNSKDKNEYERRTGNIEYYADSYLDLPNRDHGNYRYMKIDSYPYPFEIHIGNANKETESIDNLKVGDSIDAYFYETNNTFEVGLNRYIQFIDKENKAYFIRGDFQKQLGFVLIGLAVSLNILSLVFWKLGKLEW